MKLKDEDGIIIFAKRKEFTAQESLSLDQEDATMAHRNVTNEELAELIRRTAEAAKTYIRGDMRRYLSLITHADDYTLMAPFGGDRRTASTHRASAWKPWSDTFRPARRIWSLCSHTRLAR